MVKEFLVPLTFELLHQRVEQYIKRSKRELPGIVERAAFWIGWAGAGFALIAASTTPRWFAPQSALPFVTAGLVIELAGFAISLLLMLKREVPKLLRVRQQHAQEMDSDFQSYREIIAWLERYPVDERRERFRFVRDLKNKMSYRLGLAMGGVERLGIFPVLVVLYLQFRDWEWGSWGALTEINLVGGLLIWAMVLLYGMGWMVMGLKVRLDTYESLLEESLQKEPGA
jgi:hypothetical protein